MPELGGAPALESILAAVSARGWASAWERATAAALASLGALEQVA